MFQLLYCDQSPTLLIPSLRTFYEARVTQSDASLWHINSLCEEAFEKNYFTGQLTEDVVLTGAKWRRWQTPATTAVENAKVNHTFLTLALDTSTDVQFHTDHPY